METLIPVSYLGANAFLLLAALVLDAILGDPVYRYHPIRLMGALAQSLENRLFARGFTGRAGGVLLALGLGLFFLLVYGLVKYVLSTISVWLTLAWDLYWATHLVALKDLLVHARRIEIASQAGNVSEARFQASRLAGRDVTNLDLQACRRCGVESVSESLVDGVISPLFYLWLLGVPGILLFKTISTLDSMVGYKNQRYLAFGWFSARADDVLNYLPARLTWLLMALVSYLTPGYSGSGCVRVALKYHHVIPGPNAGWSECAAAGSLGIRIAGPIYRQGNLVNEEWLGDPEAPEGGRPGDISKVNRITMATTLIFGAICGLVSLLLAF